MNISTLRDLLDARIAAGDDGEVVFDPFGTDGSGDKIGRNEDGTYSVEGLDVSDGKVFLYGRSS